MDTRRVNIFIDTTGFCDAQKWRTHKALTVCSYGQERISYGIDDYPIKGVGTDGSLMGCLNAEEVNHIWLLDNPRELSLSELENLVDELRSSYKKSGDKND